MNLVYLIIVVFSIEEIDTISLPIILTTISKYLGAPQPLPIFYNSTLEEKKILAKTMAKQDFYIYWVRTLSNSENFLLVLQQKHDPIMEKIEIGINQQVYFLNPSLELIEKYSGGFHL